MLEPLAITEAQIHRSIVDWLAVVLPHDSVVHHSPNEGRHKVQYRVLQKHFGVRAGWPDLELFINPEFWKEPGAWSPIFLEIKKPKGRVSDNQRDVIAELKAVGCYAFIVHDIDEVREALSELMELRDGG
jgi:hypothetical protein